VIAAPWAPTESCAHGDPSTAAPDGCATATCAADALAAPATASCMGRVVACSRDCAPLPRFGSSAPAIAVPGCTTLFSSTPRCVPRPAAAASGACTAWRPLCAPGWPPCSSCDSSAGVPDGSGHGLCRAAANLPGSLRTEDTPSLVSSPCATMRVALSGLRLGVRAPIPVCGSAAAARPDALISAVTAGLSATPASLAGSEAKLTRRFARAAVGASGQSAERICGWAGAAAATTSAAAETCISSGPVPAGCACCSAFGPSKTLSRFSLPLLRCVPVVHPAVLVLLVESAATETSVVCALIPAMAAPARICRREAAALLQTSVALSRPAGGGFVASPNSPFL
jgi:hypothetical protein